MRAFICTALLLCMFTAASHAADYKETIVKETGRIRIDVKIENGSAFTGEISAVILKAEKETNISDFDIPAIGDKIDDFHEIDGLFTYITTISVIGKSEFTIPMYLPSDAGGNYIIMLNSALGAERLEIYIAGVNELAAFLEDIEKAKSLTEFKNIITANEHILKGGGLMYEDVFKYPMDEVFSKISKMTFSDVDGWIIEMNKLISEAALTEEKTKEINGADYLGIKSVLLKYETDLKLNINEIYSSLNSAKITQFEQELAGITFKSFGEIAPKILEIAAKYKSAVGTPGSGANGTFNGSSGGGSTGFSEPIRPFTTPEPVPADEISFSDLTDCEWAADSINALVKKGVLNGMGGSVFDPFGLVTREQAVKMLNLSFGVTDKGENVFSDVEKGAWYEPYINSAVKNNLANGRSDSFFGIGESITREELAVFIHRYLNHKNVTLTSGESPVFSDESEISDWALKAVEELSKCGIISGIETEGQVFFEPKKTATRAEASVMIARIIAKED